MLAHISVSPASIFNLRDDEGRHRLIDLRERPPTQADLQSYSRASLVTTLREMQSRLRPRSSCRHLIVEARR
ncbi:hypothetical protein ACLB2K_056410 [Fragaria x ananassa]